MNLHRSLLAFVLCITTATAPYLLPAAGVAAIGGLTVTQSACNVTQVITDITKFTPVLIDILQIVTVASGNSTAALQAKVTTDSADAQTLVQDYLSKGSVGIWNDMNAALNILSEDATLVFQMANVVSGPAQAKVGLIVASGQTLFAIIESLLPSAPQSAIAVVGVRHFSAHAPTSKLTLGDWTTSWNKLMTSKSGEAKLDAVTPQMQIHLHSWVVRHATFRPGR